jgi:phosphoheptose isomerase
MTDWFSRLYERYPDLTACRDAITAAHAILRDAFARGHKLLLCGNGGSASDCEHIVGELMKGFLLRRPVPETVRAALRDADPATAEYLADHLQGTLPAISLVGQAALTTAFANDVAADMAFAQQVYGYGRPGDVLLGISTSGNSHNVANALRVANGLGVRTIGLTGEGGGTLADLCAVAIRVPWAAVADVQERHLAVYHALCAQLEEDFFA